MLLSIAPPNTINLLLDHNIIEDRIFKIDWKNTRKVKPKGYLGKYQKLVGSPINGCLTDI